MIALFLIFIAACFVAGALCPFIRFLTYKGEEVSDDSIR